MSKTDSFRNYIWLIETIKRAERITLKELTRRWVENKSLSGGNPLPRRTLDNWRKAISRFFDMDIEIACDRRTNEYYIVPSADLGGSQLQEWFMDTLATSNLLRESAILERRIQLPHAPSGHTHLGDVIKVLLEGHCLGICYQSFWEDEAYTSLLEPYCVKNFKQRWYVVGQSSYHQGIKIFALDRILALTIVDQTFTLPPNFNADDYFAHAYGIIVDEEIDVERVRIRVWHPQSKYMKSLPLHCSQKELTDEGTDEYSVFSYQVCPTFDFQQELLSLGNTVEVLEPLWFRQQVVENIQAMAARYVDTE